MWTVASRVYSVMIPLLTPCCVPVKSTVWQTGSGSDSAALGSGGETLPLVTSCRDALKRSGLPVLISFRSGLGPWALQAELLCSLPCAASLGKALWWLRAPVLRQVSGVHIYHRAMMRPTLPTVTVVCPALSSHHGSNSIKPLAREGSRCILCFQMLPFLV